MLFYIDISNLIDEIQEHSIPDGDIPLLWWSRNSVNYISQSVYKGWAPGDDRIVQAAIT